MSEDNKDNKYQKPKKVKKQLWKVPQKLPSRQSMLLVEGTPSALAKGGCDTPSKRKLLKG